MPDYLFDTNHASLLYKRDPKLRQRLASATGNHFLCQPSVGALWFMVHNSARVAENEARLRVFLSRFSILEFDSAAAIEFGRIKANARRIGRPVAGIDAQIAAIARVHGLTLLTDDQALASIAGLNLDNWIR